MGKVRYIELKQMFRKYLKEKNRPRQLELVILIDNVKKRRMSNE